MANSFGQSNGFCLAVILNPILGPQTPKAKVDRATEHTGPLENA